MIPILLGIFFLVLTFAQDQCGEMCTNGLSCYFGTCTGAIIPSNECKELCSGQCILGECVGNVSNDTSSCLSGCKATLECRSGTCQPSLQTTCEPACSAQFDCVYGTCIPKAGACSPTCPSGQLCTNQNSCVYTNPSACSSSCDQSCLYGLCLTPATRCADCADGHLCNTSSSGVSCVSPSQPCSDDCKSTCSYGQCLSCTVCQNSTALFINKLAATQVDFYVLENLSVLGSGLSSETSKTVEPMTMMMTPTVRSESTLKLESLSFGSEGTTSSGLAVFGLSALTSLELHSVSFHLSSTLLIAKSSGVKTAFWNVSGKVRASVIFDDTSNDAPIGHILVNTLNLNGSLHMLGEGLFTLPPSDPMTSAGSYVMAAGRVHLRGHIGAASFVIEQMGIYKPEVLVPSASQLTSSGNVLGNNGRILIRGTLIANGPIFQPLLIGAFGGRIVVNGSIFAGGNLALLTGSELLLRARGSSLYFRQLADCQEGAVISHQLNASFDHLFERCDIFSPCVGTILNYDPSTIQQRLSFACTVRLIDSEGLTMTLLHQLSPSILNGTGNLAVWTQNSLVYSVVNAIPDERAGEGLGGLEKALIGIGVLVFVATVSFVAVCYYTRKQRQQQEERRYLFEGSSDDDGVLPRAALDKGGWSE